MSGEKVTKYTTVSNGKVFRVIDESGSFLTEIRSMPMPLFGDFLYTSIREFSDKASAEAWIKNNTWNPV